MLINGRTTMNPFRLAKDQAGQSGRVNKDCNQYSDQTGQHKAMQKDEPHNTALGAISVCGGARNNDALRGDHLAHHTSTGVGRRH